MEAVSTMTSSLLFTSREHGRDRLAQASLPHLRTQDAKEIARRDSINSSSRDSGYNSDLEFSLSPLDIGPQDIVSCSFPLPSELRSVPIIESTILEDEDSEGLETQPKANSAILLRRLGKSIGKKDNATFLVQQARITSNPSPTVQNDIPQLDWTSAPFKHNPTHQSTKLSLHDNLLSPSGHIPRRANVGKWIDESFPFHDRPKERVSSIVSLSSSGSGGDYSITDDSEDELANMESPILSKATIKTIDLIMRKIEINLRYAAYLQHAGGAQSSGRRQGSGSGATSSRRGSTQGLGGNQGGKRKGRNGADDGSLHPDDGDQDEDGPSKRRRVSIATTDESEASGPRFACPFFKHDPMKYRNRRTCPGPGWPSVHRMKEHLYRSHAQPIYCPRCYTMFDADADLTMHLRSDTDPCHMSNAQAIEGIDRNMEATLRRRTTALRPEEDKWRDVYLILFPETEETDIPSPYYDSSSPTEESRRFRRELLQRIHRELVSTAEHDTSGTVEQNLLRRVAGIIQRCETDILNDFFAGAPQNIPQQQSHPHPHPYSHPPNPHPSFPNQPPLFPNTPLSQSIPEPPLSPTTLPHHPSAPTMNAYAPHPQPQHAAIEEYWHESIDGMPLPSSGIIDWSTVFPFGWWVRFLVSWVWVVLGLFSWLGGNVGAY
ncbi:hypothetical protein B0J11DRAFT_89705 [Dendryphion nanum]|uniref:C2H2-type domain-containing protein n=1 Tax=Dendryphion nanum TaxID=256645 RepID=A0A9P9DEG5_9PLEO|nr:hypothetical protein B0J11DRAFT_89705 [Dendryphion nanum]